MPVNTSCASFRCENSNSVVILPGAYSPAELTATAHGGRNRAAVIRELARYGCMAQMQVLRLLAPRIENESPTKDIDFSALGISARREAGYAECARAGALARQI